MPLPRSDKFHIMKKSTFAATVVLFLFIALSSVSQTVQTLVLRPGPADGMDSDIRTDMPQTPRGWSPDFIANAWTAQGNFFIQRSLLKFDLSQIPATATVLEAKLHFFTNLTTGHYQLDSGANKSFLYRVTAPWTEDQVTWDTQPSFSLQDPVVLPQSVTHTQSYSLDVTAHVGAMVQKPVENYGWIFKLETEERYRCMVFASSDNATVEWRPELTVRYSTCSDPVADFSHTGSGMEIQFTDISNHADSWHWDFGDATYSFAQNPVHLYASPGNYRVCLVIEDSCGTATHCDTVVTECANPVAGFAYGQQDTTVSFIDTTHCANPVSWFWQFGDGGTSTLQNPVHEYAGYGAYQVCLTIADSCGSGTTCAFVQLLVPLRPGFTATQQETNNLKVAFHDSSTGATNWLWDFGDGKTSAEQNPVHLYDQYGSYLVCLTAGNQVTYESACDTLRVKKISVDSKGNSIVCYPNPCDGQSNFWFILFEDTDRAEITITDYAGRKVMMQEFTDIKKNEPVSLDISKLGKGTYVLEGSFNNYKRTVKVTIL
jgi:PKD repeat protein